MKGLVSISEFIKQVWDTEHVRISLNPKPGYEDRLVRPYAYEPLSDTDTVDDLKYRINECVNEPFITIMNI